MLLRSRNFLATLSPADRIAILSFDSHLKVWTDFTNDHDRLEQLFARGLLFEKPGAMQAPSSPSLIERLSPEKARHTYGIERALQLIGEALEPAVRRQVAGARRPRLRPSRSLRNEDGKRLRTAGPTLSRCHFTVRPACPGPA